MSQPAALLPVMTLNIAHGRRDGPNQALLKREIIESNLDGIAEVLLREKPDLVALQEADGPSLWSGRFDHVAYLAKEARFPHSFRGEHVKGWNTSYGTAILSRMPLGECSSMTFAPSPPTFSKGFVVATINWPGSTETRVTVVSVHLDFSRSSVRRRQIEEMITALAEKPRPLVVMGDFNCQWSGEEATLRLLVKRLGLAAYEPTAGNMETFPSHDTRLDWILISPELEFDSYKTLTDTLSDHRGVITRLKPAKKPL